MLTAFNDAFQSLAFWFSDSALWVLFFSGFLSATLLPGGSEAGLLAVLNLKQFTPLSVVLVATLGNALGGMTNYGLGCCLPSRLDKESQANKALKWLNKYGYWSLFFSWLPVIGDPLCLAAGWLRMHFWQCLGIIFIGKALRYSLLAAIFYGFF